MRSTAVASWIALASATPSALIKRKDGLVDGHGGDSTYTQGQSLELAKGAAGRTSYTYVSEECYDEANNPVIYHSSDNKMYIQNNQTDTNWGGNNDAQNNLNDKFTNTNWYFDIYDAYFNGSVSIKVEPPAGARCEYEETQAIPYSYLRIGMMSRANGKYSRKDYDPNPFYFRLGRYTDGAEFTCQYTSRKMFASLESSNNGFDHLQVWTTQAKLNGDKYDISGSVTTKFANENNYFNMLPFASSNTSTEAECPSHFYAATLLQNDNATMNGSVSATTADLNWYFKDADSGWSVTGTFSGNAWKDGAKLDFSKNSATPVTTGRAKRVNCEGDDCDDDGDGSFVEKHEKGIIGGGVVGGVIILAIIGAAAFFLWKRSSKQQQYNAARQVDHDDAFAMDDHYDEREMKNGTAAGLRAVSSQQNLLPGYGVDTSYDSHRSHSPDPTAPGLPAYSDNYTPLR